MKNPKWTQEETKLALQLYLSKSIEWHSKISDKTDEIVALSHILNRLDLIDKKDRGDKFRSPSAIRLKFANFKTLDPRYKQTAMSNVSNCDRDVWNTYGDKLEQLKKECMTILQSHYNSEKDSFFNTYCAELQDISGNSIDECAHDLIVLAKRIQKRAIDIDDSDFSKGIIDDCYSIIGRLEDICNREQINSSFVEHAGINQKPISDKKIGKTVKNTIEKMIENNSFSIEDMNSFLDSTWSREVLHLSHPFAVEVNPEVDLNEQLCDSNGYVRYWKNVYKINGKKYCFCKEWYEPQRKHFLKWLNSIEKSPQEDYRFVVEILNFIKEQDEKSVFIKKDEVLEKFSDKNTVNYVLDKLFELKVIRGFHGIKSEFVVDDYDLLFELIDNPKCIMEGN